MQCNSSLYRFLALLPCSTTERQDGFIAMRLASHESSDQDGEERDAGGHADEHDALEALFGAMPQFDFVEIALTLAAVAQSVGCRATSTAVSAFCIFSDPGRMGVAEFAGTAGSAFDVAGAVRRTRGRG